MDFQLELPLEPNLIGSDIATGSYNYINDSQAHGGPTKGLVLRKSDSDGGSKLQALKFSKSTDDLEKMCPKRYPCSKCNRYYKYYCQDCCIPILPNTIPSLQLPINIDIIKHICESNSKSTANQAKVICPDSVQMYDYPKEIPTYDKSDVILVYPDEKSTTISSTENFGNKNQVDFTGIKKILFIDGTWKQSRQIRRHQNLNNLQSIRLGNDVQTQYWRSQKGYSDEGLATIEAIYYFLKEYHEKVLKKPYDGEYDDILFIYKFLHKKIYQLHST